MSISTDFKEEDIRPDEMSREQQRFIESDCKRLLSFKEKFVDVNCPACGSSRKEEAMLKNGLTYCNCLDCKTMYTNPRPTEEILKECYSLSEVYKYWNESIYPASEETRKEKIFIPRLNKIKEFCSKYNVGTNLLIEVGAGYGTFSEIATKDETFNRVIAIEPSPDSAKSCESRGVEVINDTVERVNLNENRADVVVSFEVIEHLFSPYDFVKNCMALLKPNGLLVISCPSIDGFDISTLGSISGAIDHEHLNYFSPKSLGNMVERAGFQLLELITPGELDVDIVRKAIMNNLVTLKQNSFMKILFDERYEELKRPLQTFLKENKLSSHLWCIAKK